MPTCIINDEIIYINANQSDHTSINETINKEIQQQKKINLQKEKNKIDWKKYYEKIDKINSTIYTPIDYTCTEPTSLEKYEKNIHTNDRDKQKKKNEKYFEKLDKESEETRTTYLKLKKFSKYYKIQNISRKYKYIYCICKELLKIDYKKLDENTIKDTYNNRENIMNKQDYLKTWEDEKDKYKNIIKCVMLSK
jgi:hypothetical protein